jgi:hypothetical protein
LPVPETVSAQADAGYKIICSQKIESKNFYFISLIGYFNEVKAMIQKDEDLSTVALRKYNDLQIAENYLEILNSLRFTESEITIVGNRLKALYRPDNALGKLVSSHLIPSGCYCNYRDQDGAGLLVKAWEQDARGINHVIDIYGEGQKPYYPLIDSISFVRDSPGHRNMLMESRRYLLELLKGVDLFYTSPLQAALLFLNINERNEAVDFEPMSETVNKKAYEHIHTIDWDMYPYSIILMLGSGPNEYVSTLNREIKPRLKMVALKYLQGTAPFIVVSGGRVHPYKTLNSEAFFMKKYLMEECGIPEYAIIMDPHARHTTTNVRNTVRIMFRQGIPMDKCALISSSERHISSIAVPAFAERCLNEMGVKPYELGKRINEQFIEFYPQLTALQINPGRDPLDP